MARVTAEDCIDAMTNRFRLVMCSAQRGRELASGVEPTVERDRLIKNEKNAVIALREITQGNLDVEALEDSIVRNHRRFSPIEAAAEEDTEGEVASPSAERVPSVSGAERVPSVSGAEVHAEVKVVKMMEMVRGLPLPPPRRNWLPDTEGLPEVHPEVHAETVFKAAAAEAIDKTAEVVSDTDHDETASASDDRSHPRQKHATKNDLHTAPPTAQYEHARTNPCQDPRSRAISPPQFSSLQNSF